LIVGELQQYAHAIFHLSTNDTPSFAISSLPALFLVLANLCNAVILPLFIPVLQADTLYRATPSWSKLDSSIVPMCHCIVYPELSDVGKLSVCQHILGAIDNQSLLADLVP